MGAIKFTDNGKVYSGNVIANYGRSVLVEVDVPVKNGKKDFTATDEIGSTVKVEQDVIVELYND